MQITEALVGEGVKEALLLPPEAETLLGFVLSMETANLSGFLEIQKSHRSISAICMIQDHFP